ncbi:hypothetical protein VNI00_016610 [Paramarasmius palmivorus]|uniref:Cytochrome P450 n=1 Tax=Paramarasmius palmivorus TaxID=297713 RepID=A0AAW0BEY3_9AGAR
MEQWAKEYGNVYQIPTVFGGRRVILCDLRAIRDFYAKETWTYVGTPFSKRLLGNFGKGILWAEGEGHRRQRKALSPAFSNVGIRRLTSVFYDSAYKLKTHWDNELINQQNGVIIEVQAWMNRVAIDSIGIAGFSHDFGALDGKVSPVVAAFESLGSARPSTLARINFLLSSVIPVLSYIPTERSRMFEELKRSMRAIADVLLERSRKAISDEKSIIGLLSMFSIFAFAKPHAVVIVKAESTDGELHMSEEEVLAQLIDADERASPSSLLPSGYETTSLSLTWALIELAKHPEKQERLRKELLELGGSTDPTWDQLTGSEFLYLDAVVHETLRLHPPLVEIKRVAAQDDIIPLATPIKTTDGQVVTSVTIAKGHMGTRSKEFIPERWIGFASDGESKRVDKAGKSSDIGIPTSAQEIQGHKHILTFSDGPRTCLGKSFALAEFKAVLSVLIRSYSFEFDDSDTKIEMHRAVFPRPKVQGCDGAKVPMRVRRVD